MKRKFLLFLTLFVLCFLYIFNFPNFHLSKKTAFADDVEYTNVLADLSKDETFNPNGYPANLDDYSLSVIQIAESSDRELFIYVYQPCSPNSDLNATSINISKEIDDKLSYKNYTLTLLNSAGVFYKYKVDNFRVRQKVVRYYDISSIFRSWNELYDESPNNDNTINEVAFGVGIQYRVETDYNDKVIYSYIDSEIIYVTAQFVGFCRYDSSSSSSNLLLSVGGRVGRYEPGFDSHIVAFSTDRPIDKLMEADVYYSSQIYDYYDATLITWPFSVEENYSEIETHIANLSYSDRGGGVGNNWHHYSWSRIQSVDDFIKTEDRNYIYNFITFNIVEQEKISDEGLNYLKGMQWVLRFTETDYINTCSSTSGVSHHHKEFTHVGNVTILRLKFETNGVIYNLGVVSNKQTGSYQPINETSFYIEPNSNFWDSIKNILKFILLAVLIVLLLPFLPTILNILIFVFKNIIKFIVGMFRLVLNLFKKDKGGGNK